MEHFNAKSTTFTKLCSSVHFQAKKLTKCKKKLLSYKVFLNYKRAAPSPITEKYYEGLLAVR